MMNTSELVRAIAAALRSISKEGQIIVKLGGDGIRFFEMDESGLKYLYEIGILDLTQWTQELMRMKEQCAKAVEKKAAKLKGPSKLAKRWRGQPMSALEPRLSRFAFAALSTLHHSITPEVICDTSDDHLLRLPGFGIKALKELRAALTQGPRKEKGK